MKELLNSIKIFALLCILCGIIYPFIITVFAQTIFNDKANGSIISINSQNIGSELLAQKFTSLKYFWPRPSSNDWQTIPSGASNLAIFDDREQNNIRMYKGYYAKDNVIVADEMLFASASGVDPHISPQNAFAQAQRISKQRGLPIEPIIEMIQNNTEGRTFGFLGEERVNVLKLNLALDSYEK